MKAVVLGATRGMGRALARRLAERGDALHLLGRDADALARSAADLAARSGLEVRTSHADLADPDGLGPALDRADADLGGFDAAILTAAAFAMQDALENDPALATRLVEINCTGTFRFCEEARRRLIARGGGLLCAFGSVAGDRPRKPVALYGATKAALDAYLRGIDLRWRSRGLTVVRVKPGFVRTGMTAGAPEPPFAGDPDDVARHVVRALDRRRRVVYAPPIWRVVMTVLRALPDAVMRRVEF